MDRYAHNELTVVVEAVCAVAISASVVFGLRGVPRIDADAGWLIAFYIALNGLFGVLACTRLKWLGGEKRDFESAVPLANSDTVLPTPGKSLWRSFDWGFFAFLVVPCLVVALVWEPLVALWPLVLVPDRLAKGVYVTYWERRHGVLLWRGHVPDQPLGKGQRLYSSVRQPTS
ncbi:hypothetical protein OG830_01935 [Streptomyces sp. NBC_00121]|uniref:hypothetical protein n=1 Tax=unclassified Streptomyces TaxID=2593676 RepID=UPI0028C50929|nr:MULTISPECIES: hypothetical protein [unclassified Streptomyces]WNO62717.1 hypothetical protein RPQ02_02355 [Streptomyces sp. AM2-3-1]WSC67300.1 hypothetical protein OG807_01955 [Streptomyces sp. NBC_01760]